MIVSHCGVIMPGEDWNYCDNDITHDDLPPFPGDWEHKDNMYTVSINMSKIASIRRLNIVFNEFLFNPI